MLRGGHPTGRRRGGGHVADGTPERLSPPRPHRVVLVKVVVGVKELLEPLDKLKVVLEPALDQLLHRDDLGADVRTTNQTLSQPQRN